MKHSIFQLGQKLKISIFGIIIEGLLSSFNLLVLFQVLRLIFTGSVTFSDILKATGVLTLIFAIRLVLYTVAYTGSQIGGADVSRNIRLGIGDKLKHIPLGRFTKNRTGYYINAATTEVSDFEQILTHKLADIAKYIVTALAIGVYTLTLHAPSGIATLLSTLMLIPAMLMSRHYITKYGSLKNRAREDNVSAITEYLNGGQTLRSYHLVGQKNAALTASMKAYSDISYLYEKAILPIGYGFHFLNYCALAIVILLAAKAWISGSIDAATLLLLVMLPLFLTKIHLTLFISLISYRNLLISRNKITNILGEKEEPRFTEHVIRHGTIAFDNVSFAYVEGEDVLKGIHFTIPARSFTAIVGDSGAGKSTIFNLISRYYVPQKGSIYLDGKDISNMPAEEVLKSISLVDQDVFLFDDTIRNNIRYARPNATDEEIEHACRLANCDTYIRTTEKGYDTEIGENGSRLSGGERQRLSIARALVKNSPIVLLDEATSSLDIENELLVKQAISQLLQEDKTIVMIAHTLPIVQDADRILVLHDGKILESGTHEDLLKHQGKYAAMWKASQTLHQNL